MMEAVVHRGRWNKKAPVGAILLLMCMFTPNSTSLQPSEEQRCQYGEYLSEKGICCNQCSPGFMLAEQCRAEHQRSNCTRCPDGQYTAEMNNYPRCMHCRRCKAKNHEVQESPCQKHQNTICRCTDGYYKFHIDSETYQCLKCAQCRPDEEEKQTCTPERNTVCECKENYYRVNGKCKPCETCSAECKHHCPLPSPPTLMVCFFGGPHEAPDTGKEYLLIAAGVLVSVVLVVVMAIRRSTKKKLLKSSSQPSDVSSDSCEQLLIHSEELSNNISDKAAPPSPMSEQEPSNVPDCASP